MHQLFIYCWTVVIIISQIHSVFECESKTTVSHMTVK